MGISVSRQQPQSLITFLWPINCLIVTWFKKKSIIISKGQCVGGPLTLIATSRSSSVPLQTVAISVLRIRLGSKLLVACWMSLAEKILIGYISLPWLQVICFSSNIAPLRMKYSSLASNNCLAFSILIQRNTSLPIKLLKKWISLNMQLKHMYL